MGRWNARTLNVALVVGLAEGDRLELEAVGDVVDLLHTVLDIIAALLLGCVGARVCSSVWSVPSQKKRRQTPRNTY